MKSTDLEPRFIEPGDDQDECLALPLYVTRQVDDETRRAQEARKQLLAAGSVAAEEERRLKKPEQA